jgi:hypothetical protein
MFPKFFFVFNSSLIGAIFVTYGVSTGLLSALGAISPQARVMVHLLVFVPALLFGVLYQMVTSQKDEPAVVPVVVQAAPQAR